ncbi:MAG: AAA family ATPase [Chloroflexi bacterium]|nr:AAA family ATPase [Chloroflexota bacterium]
MAELTVALDDALSGQGRLVMLVGEPGIGKTRTAQELAALAQTRGAQVLWGRCYEETGAPPYWPWVQAIRSYVTDKEAETLRAEMGSTASVIAEIVPDVKERLPDLQAPPQIDDPESARFRLFDSISTFLKKASSAQPIVLMLEDLHWSDKPSLLLLEFVTRELSNSRLMIVGNYRDVDLNRRHPLSLTLGELTRERLFDRVLLRGLQKHDVRRFIEVAAGIDPPTALVDAVFTQTEGNPLFVTETVRLLIQEGDISSGAKTEGGTSSWEIRIPEGVREVIGRRLDRLSERCNEVLTTAAVVGRQFRFGVLMKLVEDASENMLLDVLDEALDARIVEEVPSEVGLYQFTHALMQETLAEELSLSRRVRLHARIAEALEEFYGSEVEEHAEELVEHLAEAEVVLGSEKVIGYSLIAADKALNAHGFESAMSHYQRILEKPPEEIKPEIKARVLEGHGLCGSALAGYRFLEEDMQGAFDLYLSVEDYASALRVARYPIPGYGNPIYLPMFRKALEISEPGSDDEAWISTRYGVALANAGGDKDEIDRSFNIALKRAEESGDTDLAGWAHGRWMLAEWKYGNYQRAAENAELAIKYASHGEDWDLIVHSQSHAVFIGLVRGDLTEAATHVQPMEQGAKRSPKPIRTTQAANFALELAYARGDWNQVRKSNTQDQEAGRISLTGEYLTWAVAQAPDHDSLEVEGTAPERSSDDAFGGTSSLLTDALIAFLHSDLKGLELLKERLDISAVKAAPETSLLDDTMHFASAIIALGLGDHKLALHAYEGLSKVSVPFVPQAWTPHISRDRLLGSLAAVLGKNSESSSHFEKALAACRVGYVPELGWTCLYYSESLIANEGAGDANRITELQDEAIAIAQELGMKPLLERVLAQREILKA